MKHNLVRTIKGSVFILLVVMLFGISKAEATPPVSEQSYLYKASFVRAAPGKLLELIELYKNRMEVFDTAGESRPFWWRHTQGDQWDLMLLFPMGSYAEYYSHEESAKRQKAAQKSGMSLEQFQKALNSCKSWQEDVLVMGPPLKKVQKAFENTAYYHIEIFVSLPGKQEELLKEREMENDYQMGIGRPENLIFTRDQGAAWDLFTLGCYRNLTHWAGSADIPTEQKEKSARQAGFENASAIGPYMRTLIVMHRDTMGVAIR
jgi:hypothetical protein